MRRRQFAALAVATSLSGCSSVIPQLGPNDLGETVGFAKFEISVLDAMTTEALTTINEFGSVRNTQKHESPSNGVFALFKLRVENTDVTELEGPAVNTANYDDLTEDPNTVSLGGPNDIRVFGGDEGGHVPEGDLGSYLEYNSLRINGVSMPAYPAEGSHFGPRIGPAKSMEGWTFGTIPQSKTPRIKIVFKNKTEIWTSSGEDLSTPTPDPEVIEL